MTRSRSVGLAAAILLATAATAGAERLVVAVKESRVRQNPASYAKPVASVTLGQKLESDEKKGDWYRIEVGGVQGWLHRSAVAGKGSGGSGAKSVGTSEVSGDEVTLAGKGFNEQVEKEYREKHPEASFAAVDAMEKIEISDDEVRSFVEEGETR
jgi:hypothetical protein